MDLVTLSQTLVGKEFHARGPATEKALSLRRRLVRGRPIQKSPRELERKRVSEQRSPSSVFHIRMISNRWKGRDGWPVVPFRYTAGIIS